MKNTVIYHRADFDGIFCREIARKFLPEGTEFVGWDYGDEKLPLYEGKIYILDLSPECLFTDGASPDMNVWTGLRDRLVWIDHHKSAIEKFQEIIPGYRIDGVAACRLAWQWFSRHELLHHPTGGSFAVPMPDKQDFIDRNVSEPLAVRLAGEYDIWDKRDPNADTFQFGLRSRDLCDSDWRIMLGKPRKPSIEEIERMMDVGHPFQLRPDGTCDESVGFVEGLLNSGRLIQRYQREQDASVVKRAFEVKWEGFTFLALNTARCNSLTFESAAQPIHDGLMGFYFDGQKYRVSLYHSPHHKEHDLSLIAVKYGGGGHRGACGFTVDKLPFLT